MTRICAYSKCEVEFEPTRPHHRFHSESCRYWHHVEERENAAHNALQPSSEHPLREVRADQEASDLKSKLSQIIYQGIVDRLEHGAVHADDLEPLFAPEVRDVCRRLVGAQFGSLASRRYIHETERRKSKVPARKGAKSGVYEFTRLGREKLAGVSADGSPQMSRDSSAAFEAPVSAHPGRARPTGAPTSKESGSDTNPAVPSASDQSSPVAASTSQPAAGETLSLLPEPDQEVWAA